MMLVNNVSLMLCRALGYSGLWALEAGCWCSLDTDRSAVVVRLCSGETSAVPEREVEMKAA